MENAVELLERQVNALIDRLEHLNGEIKKLENENRALREKQRLGLLKLRKLLDTLDNLGL